MKQVSPARLTQPLLRKPAAERGAGEFEPISWDGRSTLLTERLRRIRAPPTRRSSRCSPARPDAGAHRPVRAPVRHAQLRAHGGFCSVNMAAGMIYTVGGSFWEFGGPDLERAKLFVMIGTAEDHHSNR